MVSDGINVSAHELDDFSGVIKINEAQVKGRLGSRSSVDRFARRACLTRLCLGEGNNGTVRYVREEVLAYETNRQVKGHP